MKSGHLEDLGLDRTMILKLIFKKWYVAAWTGSGPGQGWVAGDLVYYIEPSGFHKKQVMSCPAEYPLPSQE